MTIESERQLRLYETILSNTPDFVYVFDLDHRFIYANDVLLKMWGKSWSEAIGRNCLELGYEAWHAEMHGREIEQVKATRQPIRGEVPFTGTFGRRIYDYIFVPVIGPDGEVEAIAGTTRDVTERKQIEEALRETNLRKDEFLAMLAHELRNPLAPIAAAADLMEAVKLDDAQIRNTSQIIGRQVRHMTNLINDLLDVSRVTRGLIKIEQSPQDLKSIVSHAIEQVRPLIEAQGHNLSLELGAAPATVSGDQKRLIQIVSNLLNNAAKYTPQGGNIHLVMRVDTDHVVLSVTDDGIGISAELQARIFDLFTQGERTPDRSQGGLGIGLSLVKTLTELHGGTISCASEGLGRGSCFVLNLPRMIHCEIPEDDLLFGAGTLAKAETKLRILLVDDNVDAAQMLSIYLDALGHEVWVEHDSPRALERARAFRPDVCLIDIGLPDIDGYALAGMLKNDPATAAATLIALTGYGRDQDREQAIAAGFEHHLLKPVDTARLTELLNAHIRQAALSSG